MFSLSQQQPGAAAMSFGTDTSGVRGLGQFRPAVWGRWGQRSPSTCVPARGKSADRDPAHVPEQAGRGGQPPSEPLCKCQHPNQSRNAVSVEMLPRRTGSVSIQEGSEDLCQHAPVVISAEKFSPTSETFPSEELFFIQCFTVNSCVVFLSTL